MIKSHKKSTVCLCRLNLRRTWKVIVRASIAPTIGWKDKALWCICQQRTHGNLCTTKDECACLYLLQGQSGSTPPPSEYYIVVVCPCLPSFLPSFVPSRIQSGYGKWPPAARITPKFPSYVLKEKSKVPCARKVHRVQGTNAYKTTLRAPLPSDTDMTKRTSAPLGYISLQRSKGKGRCP